MRQRLRNVLPLTLLVTALLSLLTAVVLVQSAMVSNVVADSPLSAPVALDAFLVFLISSLALYCTRLDDQARGKVDATEKSR